MWLCFAGVTQDERGGFGKNFFAVKVFHNDMIGAVKGDEVFLLRADVAINFAPIACRNHVIVNRGHNERGRGDLWQFCA